MTNLNNTRKLRDVALDYIRHNPGATSQSISKALGCSETAAATAVSRLFAKNAVSRQRAGRYYAYFLPAPKPAAGEQDDAKVIEALRAEIERLTKWQADAVAKHPDLRADPLLLKARDIAASVWDDDGDYGIADAVRRGDYDADPEVRAALAALKSVEAQ